MAKEWKDCTWAECPDCGDAVEVYTDGDGDYVYDGDDLRCIGCGLTGWTSCDDGDAWDNWDGY